MAWSRACVLLSGVGEKGVGEMQNGSERVMEIAVLFPASTLKSIALL